MICMSSRLSISRCRPKKGPLNLLPIFIHPLVNLFPFPFPFSLSLTLLLIHTLLLQPVLSLRSLLLCWVDANQAIPSNQILLYYGLTESVVTARQSTLETRIRIRKTCCVIRNVRIIVITKNVKEKKKTRILILVKEV